MLDVYVADDIDIDDMTVRTRPRLALAFALSSVRPSVYLSIYLSAPRSFFFLFFFSLVF